MPDHHETEPNSKLVASSPLEKGFPKPVDCLEMPQLHLAQDRIEKAQSGKEDRADEFRNTSLGFMDHGSKTGPNLHMRLPSYTVERNKTDINSTQYESSLFSSSFSEIFSRKLRLPVNETLFHQPIDNVDSCYKDEKPFKSVKVEPPNIGNFLPDEDDLLSGMIDEVGFIANASSGDDVEEFDLFSSGGGMELGGDERLCAGQGISDFTWGISNGQVVSHGSVIGEQPSRTIFVRNISSCVEDSELRVLFEQYGDIQALFTGSKHRGSVMVSFYDIRSARNAMRALQYKQLKGRKLDVHYTILKDNLSEKDITHGTLRIFNVDSSVSNAELQQIFGVYGEIREIRETLHSHCDKFIEFYDVRAAEAAFHALNRKTISGKQIKIEPAWPEGARCLMQLGCSELEESKQNMSQIPEDSMRSNRIATISPGLVISRCMDNESTKGLHSAIQVPNCGSLSVTNTLHCPLSGASGNRNGLPGHSLEQAMFGGKCVQSSHPHSLPEYHNYLGNIIPHNSISTVEDMVGSISAKLAGDSSCIGRVVSNGQPVTVHGEVLDCFGNLSCPLTGHQCTRRNNTYQRHPSTPIIWPNSPTFINGIQALCPPKLTGFPTVPPHMMNVVAPVHRHHVGSAPVVNTSIWDRRHAYAEKSSEVSGFHLGSPGTFPLRPSEIASHNMFPHAGGSCMNMSPNSGFHSPQQMCHIFPGMGPIMSSYGSASDRARGFLHRRNDVSSTFADKKQYELDIDRILHGEDNRTTLMIKNIPNKYTSKMLLAAIDEHHRGMYDFVYLPIDFKNKCNVGYAFINLIDPLQIVPFHQTFNGKKWEKFNSEKVATLAYARIQGKAALIAHFQNSSLMNEDKRCRPILFHTDGPNAGDQEPFPTSGSIRSRSGKPRSFGNEGIQYHGSPSSANFEDPSNRAVSSLESMKGSD